MTVIKSANLYTVTFGGTLANGLLPLMTAVGLNGATPVVSITQDGSLGTVVNPTPIQNVTVPPASGTFIPP